MSIDYAVAIRCIADDVDGEWPDGKPGTARVCREAADEIERLRAEVERLTPREMTLQEACDVLNKHEYQFHANWRVEQTGDGPYAKTCCDEYRQDAAVYIAQGLERDAKGGA